MPPDEPASRAFNMEPEAVAAGLPARQHRLACSDATGSFWGRVTGQDGETLEGWLRTGEAYSFTACAVVQGVERSATSEQTGFQTPAAAFGEDFAEKVSGNRITSHLPV